MTPENQRDEEEVIKEAKKHSQELPPHKASQKYRINSLLKIILDYQEKRQSWEREKAELKAEYNRKLLALSEQTVNRIYLYEGSDLEAETLNRLEKEKAGLEYLVEHEKRRADNIHGRTIAELEERVREYKTEWESALYREQGLKSRNAELEAEKATLIASKLVVPSHPEETFDKVLDVAKENNRLKAENAELQKESYECTCTKELHGSLCRYCYIQTALSVCKENTEQKETISRLTSALVAAHEKLRESSGLIKMLDRDRKYPSLDEHLDKVKEILSDPTGQLAFEKWKRMEMICKKSVGWWLGKRPTNYTKQMHLENPDINCPTKSEQKLAKAVAEFEALDAKGEV